MARAPGCTAAAATAVLGTAALCAGASLLAVLVAIVLGCSRAGGTSSQLFGGLPSPLQDGETCYRFCESGRGAEVARRDDCAPGLSCTSTFPPGWVGFDNCDYPDICSRLGPCAGYSAGQACVNGDNLAHCHQLLDSGCAEADLIVMESCPVQFDCSSPPPTPVPNEPQAICGPAGNVRAERRVCRRVQCSA